MNEIIYMYNNLRNKGKKPPILYVYSYYLVAKILKSPYGSKYQGN